MNTTDPFGLVGQMLEGQFRVDQFVGDGGFSSVYRGHHTGLNEPIAIKCLKLPGALGTAVVDTFMQRFRDESRILYRLSQGNLHIVRSIAAGTTTSAQGVLVPYMILEWLEGTSLASELADRRARGESGRPLDVIVPLFASAADALSFAHAQGVVHRDLNPGNFFLATTSSGTKMKVLDFGVAKVMHDSTLGLGPRAQTIGQMRIFAPAYGAPEQFDDSFGPVGASSDVYSFALVLLEALRDRPVNEGAHLGELAQAAVDPARRPTPSSLGIDVSNEVEAVFARATKLDSRERWPTVAEMWQALLTATSAKPKMVAKTLAFGVSPAVPPPPQRALPSSSRVPLPSSRVALPRAWPCRAGAGPRARRPRRSATRRRVRASPIFRRRRRRRAPARTARLPPLPPLPRRTRTRQRAFARPSPTSSGRRRSTTRARTTRSRAMTRRTWRSARRSRQPAARRSPTGARRRGLRRRRRHRRRWERRQQARRTSIPTTILPTGR